MNNLIKHIKWWKFLLISIWIYFTYLMIQITLKYSVLTDEVAFLAIKQDEVEHVNGYLPVFYIHVFFSIFVLLIGLVQLFPIAKIVPRRIHQWLGYAYVIIVVIFAAPSGIFIGYYANGGLGAKFAFIILGILWIFYTIRALVRIKNKNFKGHQRDMWRSYALTLSALTLRLWKVIIVYLFKPNPMEAYIVVAWLGWVLNLILIEIYINYSKK